MPAEALDSTAVMMLAPVPRFQWRAVTARLATVTRVVKPAAPNLLAQRKPFEVLQRLRIPFPAIGVLNPANPSDAEWQRLARLPTLWYVRRRNLAYRDDYTGAWRQVTGIDERRIAIDVRTRLDSLGLTRNFDAVLARATPAAASAITSLLASQRFAESPTLTAAAIGSLSSAASADTADDSLDQSRVLNVASDLNAPRAGEGLQKVEQAVGKERVTNESLQTIAANDNWKQVDAAAKVATRTEVIEIANSRLGVTPRVVIPTRPVINRLVQPDAVAAPTATATPAETATPTVRTFSPLAGLKVPTAGTQTGKATPKKTPKRTPKKPER
jgi:hypothetical protein